MTIIIINPLSTRHKNSIRPRKNICFHWPAISSTWHLINKLYQTLEISQMLWTNPNYIIISICHNKLLNSHYTFTEDFDENGNICVIAVFKFL